MTTSIQTLPATTPSNGIGDDENYVINGDMVIAQAGNSVAGIAAAAVYSYGLDMMASRVFAGATPVLTASQMSDHPILAAQGFSWQHTITTADAAVAAGDRVDAQHRLEGFQIAQFLTDSAGFTPFCISFWAKTNVAGNPILPVSFVSGSGDRAFPSSVTLGDPGVWKYFVVPIDSTNFTVGGTWQINPPSALQGASVIFSLMAGTNFTSAAVAETWNAAGNTGLFIPGGFNFCGTIGNTLQIADLKIQRGVVGTAYRREAFAKQLADCQRYYWQTFEYGVTPASSSTLTAGTISYSCTNAGIVNKNQYQQFPVEMRVAPTITFFNYFAAGTNWRATTGNNSGASSAVQTNTKSTTLVNPQSGTDAVGDRILIHASFDARV